MNESLKGWMKAAAAKLQEAAEHGVEKRAFAPGAAFDPSQQAQMQGGQPGMDPAAMQGGGMPPGMDPAMMQQGGGGMAPPPPGGDPAAMGGGQDPIAMLLQSIEQINQKVDSMAGGGMAGGAAGPGGAPKPPKIDVPATLQTILQRLDTQNKMLAAICTKAGIEFQAKDLLPPEIGGEPGMQPVMEQPQPQPAGGGQAKTAVQELGAMFRLFKALDRLGG